VRDLPSFREGHEVIEGFGERHLAGFDQGETRRRAREEDEAGVDHVRPPL
jgi:hypothetical protein